MVDLIIGVDCATAVKKVGLARASRQGARFEVTHAFACAPSPSPVELVASWIGEERTALIALDAPLGWPASLGRALVSHRAGQRLTVPANLLFRRHTDRFVAERTGKTPLDVGADRIARTALWALFLLEELRKELQESIPLAWDIPPEARVSAIEVYPAATLLAHGASLKGYKAAGGFPEREAIFGILSGKLDCRQLGPDSFSQSDALDAIACTLAGQDFLRGCAAPPDQPDLARQEGWIWFSERADRKPHSSAASTSELYGA